MNKFTFHRTVMSDLPGYEMDYYSCDDFEGTWITPRGCMVAVLCNLFGYSEEDFVEASEYTLEMMLLDNDIYVCFEDSYEDTE